MKILVIIGLGIVFLILVLITVDKDQFMSQESTVTISGKIILVDVARTPSEQIKGLGYQDSMPQDKGLLFVYPAPRELTFWMKGMRFPIDILFIKDKTITTIHSNVLVPQAGMLDEHLPRYASQGDADMVLEINAGLAKEYGFEVGDKIDVKF